MTKRLLLTLALVVTAIVAIRLLARPEWGRRSVAKPPREQNDREDTAVDQLTAPPKEPRTAVADSDASGTNEWRQEAAAILLDFIKLGVPAGEGRELSRPLGETFAAVVAAELSRQIDPEESTDSLRALKLLQAMGSDAAGTESQILNWASGNQITLLRKDAARALVAQRSSAARSACLELCKIQLSDCERSATPNAEQYEILRSLIGQLGAGEVTDAAPFLLELIERAQEVEEPDDAEALLREDPGRYWEISRQKWSNEIAAAALTSALKIGSSKAAHIVLATIFDSHDSVQRTIALDRLREAIPLATEPDKVAAIRQWVLTRMYAPASIASNEARAAITAAGCYGDDAADALLGIDRATLSSLGIQEAEWMESVSLALQRARADHVDTLVGSSATSTLRIDEQRTRALVVALLKSSDVETRRRIQSLLDIRIPEHATILLESSPPSYWRDKLDILKGIALTNSLKSDKSQRLALDRLAELDALTPHDWTSLLATKDLHIILAIAESVVHHAVRCSSDVIASLVVTVSQQPVERWGRDPNARSELLERLVALSGEPGPAIVRLLADDTWSAGKRLSIFAGLCRHGTFAGPQAAASVTKLSCDCRERTTLVRFWTRIASELGNGPPRWWLATAALGRGDICDPLAADGALMDLIQRIDSFVHKYEMPSSFQSTDR